MRIIGKLYGRFFSGLRVLKVLFSRKNCIILLQRYIKKVVFVKHGLLLLSKALHSVY